MDNESVAVVIATFGDRAVWDPLADRALASVRAQTHQPDEISRVHGNSLHEARNEGVLKAACDFIIVLDADDELDERYIEAMLAGQGDWRVPYIQRVRQGVVGSVGMLKTPGSSLYERNHIPIGAMIRRELLLRVGGFHDWPIYEDWAAWMKLEAAGVQWSWCPEAIYRIHWRSGSRNDNVELRAPTLVKIRASLKSSL